MKSLIFPDAWVKSYTLSQRVKLEDKRDEMIREIDSINSILFIAEHREELVNTWNTMKPEDRARIGESQDKNFVSPISFKNVAHLEFADLPLFWQGAWFTGMASSKLRMKVLEQNKKGDEI